MACKVLLIVGALVCERNDVVDVELVFVQQQVDNFIADEALPRLPVE
jgi:hypothetical protein